MDTMNPGGLSASDVALLNTDGFGGGGNAFVWIFGLLILMSMFNGGFGNNGYRPQYATQQDVQYTSQFGQLLDGNRDIINNVTSGAAQSVAATNQAKYDNINVMKDVQMALANQIADVKTMEQNILGNQNDCCCSTKMMIADAGANLSSQLAQNKYENAMNLAGLEQRLTAKMDANKIEDLQNQVNQLQLAQATNGMLRFPNSWSYGAGAFPPIFGGCGYQNV
jgi:hypothetical protein